MARHLHFRIVKLENPGFTPRWVKIRDTGVQGPCVGDEHLLWQALQEALAERDLLRGKLREQEALLLPEQRDEPRRKRS